MSNEVNQRTMMQKNFETEEEFETFLNLPYQFDRCGNCNNCVEVSIEPVCIFVDKKEIDFDDLPLLKCTTCGKLYMTDYAKEILCGAYTELKKRKEYCVKSCYSGYKKRFDYCQNIDFEYDHRDYTSIPRLCYDVEHSKEGFLQPVYFLKDALIAFVGNPKYEVDLFSESYGKIALYDSQGMYKYEWVVPFGFNSSGKLVMWLGDIDSMDQISQLLLKAYNIPSDHLLVESEFYQAQMNCIFSNPSIEMQIVEEKKRFIQNVKRKYGIELSHLTEQDAGLEKQMQRPIAFTNQALFQVINAFRRHLIEGVSVSGLREFYEKLYKETEREKEYKKFGTIKLTDKILSKLVPSGTYTEQDLKSLIAPLYLLNDYRTILDHSIGSDEEKLKNNILQNLGIDSFDKQEEIYLKEIGRLRKLYQMLALTTK